MSNDKYRKLLSRHLDFIQKKCEYAVRFKVKEGGYRPDTIVVENEALELFNRVIDLLKRDDYKVLRQFKGRSTLKTYLNMIIANQMVEMIRKKRGRDRSKERAKKLGPIGLQLYQKVMKEKKSLEEAYGEMKAEAGFSLSLSECEDMLREIRGKKRRGKNELAIADVMHNPESLLLEADAQEKVSIIIKRLMSQLNGKDRLILRMRFPADEDTEPLSIDEIARMLNFNKKAVYMRISRALEKSRKILEQSGINFNDLFP